MAGSSLAKKKSTRAREKAKEQPPEAVSPTSEALKALKNLASPASSKTGRNHASNETGSNPSSDRPRDNLRIQAPAIRHPTGEAGISGPTSRSPAGSGPSAQTSPADDGLDTPDSRDNGPSKRPRLVDPSSTVTTPTPTTPPLFLEKTYEMLDKCSPQVACWSSAGDSFIVKNPVAFAEHVIPIYFKHKNFSSFVRQLNFYGFRKVRVVDPDVTGGVDPKDWWEFRHDKFQRGRKELLREIKRRSLPSSSSANHATSVSGGDATAAAVDRSEVEELRNEVATLREQIQTLNKHMFSVMQIIMTRNTPAPTATAGTPQAQASFPSSHAIFPPPAGAPHVIAGYPFVGGLPPPHPTPTAAVPVYVSGPKTDKPRGSVAMQPTVVSPGAVYALRPIQSFVSAQGVPSGYAYPLTPTTDPHSVDWETYSRHAYHAPQAQAPQSQTSSVPPLSSGSVSPAEPTTASSVPAVTGLKRSRSHQKRSPPAALTTTTTPPPAAPSTIQPAENPEAAVRQLSLQVTHIRADLLQSILACTLAFIGAQPPSASGASGTPLATPEIDAIASAIRDDIQQRLAQINEAEAVTHGRPRGSPPSETSHMYRVEMLKFVSKELPRAMSDAVEKRLPAATKKTLNRSLLALMVQKAQGALETHMRIETASISPSNSNSNSGSKNK